MAEDGTAAVAVKDTMVDEDATEDVEASPLNDETADELKELTGESLNSSVRSSGSRRNSQGRRSSLPRQVRVNGDPRPPSCESLCLRWFVVVVLSVLCCCCCRCCCRRWWW